MRALRSDAKASGTQISNALNNAISPTQASRGITSLSHNLTQLAGVAKLPGENFKVTAGQMSKDLGMLAQKTGLSEKEFAKLNEKILRTSAHKNAERSLQGIARSAGLSAGEAKKLAIQMGFTEKEAQRLTKSMKDNSQTGQLMAKSWMAAKVAAAAIVVGGGYMLKQIISINDQYSLLQNRLSLVTGSEQELAAVEKELYQISIQTHGAYSDTVTMFTRFAQATKEAGVSQKDLLTVTRAINEAIIVSGASTAEASAAIIQLSQGMASGTLRGEELNSVMEQTPRLAQMIADGMGITIGQLREYGKEGKLTSEMVINALKDQAGVVHEEFGKMGVTVGQAWQDVTTIFNSIIAEGGQSVGVTESLSGVIQDLGKYLDDHRDVFHQFFMAGLEGARWLGEQIDNIIVGLEVMGVIERDLRTAEQKRMELLRASMTRNIKIMNDENRTAGIRLQAAEAYGYAQEELQSILEGTWQKTEDVGEASTAAGDAAEEAGRKHIKAAGDAKEAVEDLERSYIDAAKGITDNWAIMHRDRDEVQSRALARMVENEEEALENMEVAVDEFYGDIYQKGEDHVDDVEKLQEGLVNDLGRIFDSYINDVLTGEIDSIEDLFKGLFESVLDMFSRTLSQMAANSLIDAIFGAGASGGLTLGGLIGGGTGGGGVVGGISTATGIGGIATKIAGWLGLGGGAAATALPVGIAAPTAGAGAAGGTALLPGGAGGGGAGGLGGLGSLVGPGMVTAVFGATLLGMINAWTKEKKPTTTELMNSMGLNPEDYAFAIGNTFTEAMDPVYGVMQSHMATAGGKIVTTWDHLNEDVKKINTRLYNDTTGQWEDMRLTGGAIMALMTGDIVSEIDAMAIEANYGIDGLAEHIINVSKEAQSTGDKVEDAFKDMGLEAGYLHRAMELADRAMESASGSTDELEEYLSDLGYTADDISGALDTLEGGMNKLIYDGIDPLRDALDEMGGDARALGDILGDALDEALREEAPPPPPPAPDPQPPGFPELPVPQVFVYLEGNDIINTKKLNARILYVADSNRVKADRLGLEGKPMVYA